LFALILTPVANCRRVVTVTVTVTSAYCCFAAAAVTAVPSTNQPVRKAVTATGRIIGW